MAVHLTVSTDGTITITSSPQGEVDVTGITKKLDGIEGVLNTMSTQTDAIIADLTQIDTFLKNQKDAFDALKALDAQKDVQIANLTSTVAADEAKIAADAQALADAQAKFNAAQAQVDADEKAAGDKAAEVLANAQATHTPAG